MYHSMLVKLPRRRQARALNRNRKRRPLPMNMLKKLQKDLNGTICAIEAAKGKLLALEQRTLDVRDKILEEKRFRQRKGGYAAVSSEYRRQCASLKLHSERLESVRRKTSSMTTDIDALKREIDHLRRERMSLQDISTRMQEEFVEKRRLMKDLLKNANHYYVARQVAVRRETTLKRHKVFEDDAFEAEWRSLGEQIHALSVIQESIGTAHLQREAATLRKKIEANKNDAEIVGKLKGELHAVQAQASKAGVMGQDGEARFDTPEKAFQKLHRETGVMNVEEIVHRFISTEDEVFSLFGHIQTLHEQNAELNSRLEHLEKEIDTAVGPTSGARMRRQIMEDTESRLKQVQQKSAATAEHHANQREVFLQAKAIVDRISCLFGEPFLRGEATTPSNIMITLGEVEKRAGEALASLNVQRRKSRRGARHGDVGLAGHVSQLAGPRSTIKRGGHHDKVGITVELEESEKLVELLQVC